jgi:dTMP kinase
MNYLKKLRWIVFEGIDGSGKTTQAKMLSKLLNNKGIVSKYMHVFDTDVGLVLRKLFIECQELENLTEILLLFATRVQYVRHIIKNEILDKCLLITDRYYYSIETMQGLNNQKDKDLICYLKKMILNNINPDLHILIDTPAEVCALRMNRKSKDRIENKGIEFHERVRQAYLQTYLNEPNVIIVNGNQDILHVHEEILEKIENWIVKKYKASGNINNLV